MAESHAMSEKVSLDFGFLVPKFAKQLKPQGYRLPRNHCADEVNDAISLLWLGKFITETQRDQARYRLARRILKDMVPIQKRRAAPTEEPRHE